MPRRLLLLFVLTLFVAAVGCTDDHNGEPPTGQTDTGHADTDAGDDGDGDTSADSTDDAGDAGDGADDDAGTDDAGTGDAGHDDDAGTDTGGDDADVDDGPVCGNGIVEEGQSCDDGIIEENCDTYHDGGDGYCVPPDECSDGFVLDDNGDCIEEEFTEDIDIYVDNFCNLDVDPPQVDVASGQTASFTYHNQSVDYAVDIWGFYGGGYLDLATGDSWDDPFIHCGSGSSNTETMDISISGININDPNCPGQVFQINCQ